MLAESLEALKQEVMSRFDARVVAGPGSGSPTAGTTLRSRLSELLDDLAAAVRRGHVEPARFPSGEEAVALQRDCPRSRPGHDAQRHVEGLMSEYRSLGDCIHDLIEQHELDVSSHELRILSDWLNTRACAPALARTRGCTSS
jgi:hypothetical protein